MTQILKKILAILFVTTLISCGSNQTEAVKTQLSAGISSNTTNANFGKAASAEVIKQMSAKLGSYFNGQNANNPKALIGAQAAGNKALNAVQMVAATNVSSPVFRFYNTRTGAHFFTMSEAESDYIQNTFPFFTFEGASFMAYPEADPSLSPVYRFYNKVTGTHFFTISAEEKAYVQATWPDIFTYEGISWHASTAEGAGWVPVYRFFNTKTGTHFYTTSAAERDYILATWNWFTIEGVAYYVHAAVNKPLCDVALPEKTLATLPTSYSAKLLDVSYGSDPLLNNTGYVAWLSQCGFPPCSPGQTTVKRYSTETDSTIQSPVLGDYVTLVSLNDAGVSLINAGSSMPPYDQYVGIDTLPLAKLWDGTTVTDSVVRAPKTMNHRAGRHTFSIPMSGVNDVSNRKWAYPNFPSYLDGTKLVNTSATLQLGNFPDAVNHCGIAVASSHHTKDGLYFSRGTVALNSVGEKFSADSVQYPHLGVTGLTDTKTIFGSLDSEFNMTNTGLLGFIKTSTTERYYPNAKVVDANNANTGVGYSAYIAPMPPISYLPLEGQIMATDGAHAIKPRVPSLAAGVENLIPKAINDKGQIVITTCTPTIEGTCSLIGSKLYLLTPQ